MRLAPGHFLARLTAVGVVAALTASPAFATAATPVPEAPAPSAQEVAAQQEAADRLEADLDAQRVAVAAAQTRLAALSEQAGAALEAHEQSMREQDAALAEQQLQLERLAAAQALVGTKRGEMGRWARRTYREGGVHTDYLNLMALLAASSTDDLSRRLVLLQRVGRMRGEVVETVTEAEAVQADAARRAEQAALAASLAAERAAAAKAEAERLVGEQQAQLAVLNDLLRQTATAADQARQEAERLEAARAIAEQRRLAAEAAARASAANAIVGEVGSCAGGDVGRYGNGAIPLSALCPLWGAPGHYLRADAAHGFNRLSEAYAAQHGEPLCVTDSYRTYASQVDLKIRKPDLAARAGTSNHGWGTAVDLCGPAAHFGTAEHVWMRVNAPLYGFFHPRWAQADGSKPEPWHWEYGA